MTTTADEVPGDRVVDFDVYEPAVPGPVDTMHERIADLIGRGPIVYSTAHGGHWVVTGYDLIQQVHRDPSTFSSSSVNLTTISDRKQLPIELDPPVHTAFRKALQPLFSPNRMKALEPQIRATINGLIDGFVTRGECEFVTEFAHELPASVFLTLMGWPVEDGPMFTEQTDIALLGIPGATPEESDAARVTAANQMYDYFGAMVTERRGSAAADPDDVTAAVINSQLEIDGGTRPLTDDELCQMFYLLLIAGLHTVQGSLAWSMMLLSQEPEQRQRLVADPSLIPAAVEEILRIETATTTARIVTRDTELGGVHLNEGDQVLTVLAGANRDPREFDQPDVLKIDRTPNRHLAFGSGPHRCVGSHLARIELRIALEELHRRMPDYWLDPEDPPISHASQVRGVVRLPLKFTPERH